MKLCRFQPLLFSADQISPADSPVRAYAQHGAHPEPRAGLISGQTVREIQGDVFGEWIATERAWALAEIKLLPPVVPSKIVCLGRNYHEHAAELGNPVPTEPLIFLKPPSAIIGPDEPIVLPPRSGRVDHEGELAMIIGQVSRQLAAGSNLRRYILGYTCLNDVTARDLQKRDVQFTRAKGFDTFCPIGPVIETSVDPSALSVETYVNGERRQFARASDMIFSVDVILPWVSSVMTLYPGDVIATGTPAGVGALRAGDVVEVVVAGVGTLRNPVVAPAT